MGLATDNEAAIEERARFFDRAGPVEPDPETGKRGQPPWFAHEDLDRRVSLLRVGVPEALRLRLTTRPDEKLARRQAAEATNAATAAAAADDDIDPALLLIPTDHEGGRQ